MTKETKQWWIDELKAHLEDYALAFASSTIAVFMILMWLYIR